MRIVKAYICIRSKTVWIHVGKVLSSEGASEAGCVPDLKRAGLRPAARAGGRLGQPGGGS